MRATHACLLLLQLLASSDGQATTPQCACRSTTPPQDAATMSPVAGNATTTMSPVVAVVTTTMAPVAGNATTMSPVAATIATTTMVAARTTAASDEAAPSPAPAPLSAPAPAPMDMDAPAPAPAPAPGNRLLRGKYSDDISDRQLQDEDNTSDASDNVTTEDEDEVSQTTAPTETSEAALCDCPLPQVVSTFNATLTLASAGDLAQLDFVNIGTELKSSEGWGDSAEVEVVPIVKIAVQYTLDVDITAAECKRAVVAAYSTSAEIDLTEEDVECGDASSAPAPASSPASAPAPAPAAPGPAPGPAPAPDGRRLQSVVKDVTMRFAGTTAATAAATASQDTTHFTTALGDEGVVAVVTVSETVGVTVELTFRVTSDAAIEQPTSASVESAVASATPDTITVTAEVRPVALAYTRMPCSASDICSAASLELVANAATVGCDGATCTTEETERCCATPIGQTGNAQGTCVLGSLSALLLWHFV